MKKIKKKTHFLLLELIMALSLIAICALPLIRGPILQIKKQISQIELIHIEFEKEKLLCEIKEKIYKQEIDFSFLENKNNLNKPFITKTIVIPDLGGIYKETCIFKNCLIKEDKDKTKWAKITFQFKFEKPNSLIKISSHQTLALHLKRESN